MLVALTGASGHIGGNVARELCAAGHEVIALRRKTSTPQGLGALPLTWVEGDLLDGESLQRLCEGADAVIHCAADFAIYTRDPAGLVRASVDGTKNLLDAAAAAGVGRVVVTGSAASVGASERPDDLRTERDWPTAPSVPYYHAKVEAEKLATRRAVELGLPTVVLLPTLVLGPHDHRLTPSMRPVLEIANGKQPTAPGGLNLVSVHDVARAHVLALHRGEPGERYLIAGENVTLRQLGALVAAYTERVPQHLEVPKWLVRLVAGVMEAGATVTGRPAGLTRALVDDVFGKYAWVDGSKARAAFNLTMRSATDVVEETLRWFLTAGRLDAKVALRVASHLSPAKAA